MQDKKENIQVELKTATAEWYAATLQDAKQYLPTTPKMRTKQWIRLSLYTIELSSRWPNETYDQEIAHLKEKHRQLQYLREQFVEVVNIAPPKTESGELGQLRKLLEKKEDQRV